MGKMFPFLMSMITVLVLIFYLQPIQELFFWLILVGVTFWVPRSDVNNGFILNLP